MAMLVTLYLILINTYNNIDAPSKRGFSFADVWFVGCQIPIAFAIIEYGAILGMMKSQKGQKFNCMKSLDLGSFILSSFFFCIFNVVYWSTT